MIHPPPQLQYLLQTLGKGLISPLPSDIHHKRFPALPGTCLFLLYYLRRLFSCWSSRTTPGLCEWTARWFCGRRWWLETVPGSLYSRGVPFIYRKEDWVMEWKTTGTQQVSGRAGNRRTGWLLLPSLAFRLNCLEGRLWSKTWVLFHCSGNSNVSIHLDSVDDHPLRWLSGWSSRFCLRKNK